MSPSDRSHLNGRREREKSVRSDFRELIQRSKYMERILKQTIEGIALDTKNLARLADALEADNGDRTTVIPEAKDGEAQHIDDEACTMVPVGDTTTRAFIRSIHMGFLRCSCLLTHYRLFGGVFILELFYASQKSYRKPDTRARESCMSQMLALIEARLLKFCRILILPPISHALGSCARGTTCLQQSHHVHHAISQAS